jgi:hypothetical protein
MNWTETFWAQIHELSRTVNRHHKQDSMIDALAMGLRDLPIAIVQNRQCELHIISRLLDELTDCRGSTPLRARPAAPQSSVNQDAQALARSLSELDDDGSPFSGQ